MNTSPAEADRDTSCSTATWQATQPPILHVPRSQHTPHLSADLLQDTRVPCLPLTYSTLLAPGPCHAQGPSPAWPWSAQLQTHAGCRTRSKTSPAVTCTLQRLHESLLFTYPCVSPLPQHGEAEPRAQSPGCCICEHLQDVARGAGGELQMQHAQTMHIAKCCLSLSKRTC